MSKILIVDDDPTARQTVVALLEKENYQLELVEDGFQALQVIGKIQPDLILLDVMMPGMDGFEVCRRIRATPKFAEVPIILITALDDRQSLVHGIESGADDFISKPIDRQELITRVRTITRLNRYRIMLEQRENLKELAERLVTAQEDERLRISRELHDDLGQALTTHMISLRNLQNDLTVPVSELFNSLQALYEQSYEIFVKIRQLAHDLRPPVLDTLGLQLALETYTKEFTNRTSIPVTLEIEPDMAILSDVHNIILYRVLQEALTNIAKHAHASLVWVELVTDEGHIHLIVQDNGRGLHFNDNHTSGIGITGMRERLALAGGKLTLHSPAEGGTILSASLPISTMKTKFWEGAMIRVLIAEDHLMVRAGIRALLEKAGDIHVLAEVSNGHEAVEQVEKLLPDVLIMDIMMPRMNGIQAAENIQKLNIPTRILLLSMYSDNGLVQQALQSGVKGYVLKSSVSDELLRAVRTVAGGQTYLSSQVSDIVVENSIHPPPAGKDRDPLSNLSPREKEILQLIAEEHTSSEIAKMLVISEKTVEKHRANLMEKLNVRNLAGLVRFAVKYRLVDRDS